MTGPARRILHIADPAWPGGGPSALRMLAEVTTRLVRDRHEVVVLGGAAELAQARECGVRACGNVAMPGGHALLARRAMERVGAALSAAGDEGFAIVHAWSGRAALLCDAACGGCGGAGRGRPASLAMLTVAPVEGLHAELLGARIATAPMPLLTPTESVRQELLAAGVPSELVPVLPPGIAVAEDDLEQRAALRRRWGVDEGTFVFGLVGDPVQWSDARGAVYLLALLRVAGHAAHLLMHPAAHRGAQMFRWGAPLDIDRHISLDPAMERPWQVARGLDVAISLGDETISMTPQPLGSPMALLFGGGRPSRPMPSVLPLLWTAAAGVPALAEASLAACGVIEEGQNGLLVTPRRIAEAAQRLTALADDPQLRRRLGVAAQERVREAFPLSAMAVRLRQVYDGLVAGDLPSVPLAGMPDESEPQLRWHPTPGKAIGVRPEIDRGSSS